MPFDLAALTSTPDIRCIPEFQACIVRAMRYTRLARESRCCPRTELARQLRNPAAVAPFQALWRQICRAWPDPVVLNPFCQPRLSYDEMLILDMTAAAAMGDRRAFDYFLGDMLAVHDRYEIWRVSRQFMNTFQLAAGRA